jgi:hypothetical protein
LDRFETYTLLDRIMDHFKSINEKKGLTEEDRKQIKKFYLESFITPEARKLLQKHFPEEFPTENQPVPTQSNLLRNAEAKFQQMEHMPQSLRIPTEARRFCFFEQKSNRSTKLQLMPRSMRIN